MRLKAGDMVAVNWDTMHDIVLWIPLYDGPDPIACDYHEVSKLGRGETAIVVSLSSHDCRMAYVIGPHGAGWAMGANLVRVK